MKKIILASKSIDRREIFNRAGISFDIFVTNIDEDKFKTKIFDPIELVKEIAKAKALFTKDELLKEKLEVIIVAADTVVEFNGEIIGKAQDEAEAFSVLQKLMGNTHRLITGIAITEIKSSKIIIDFDTTIVEFADISNNEIWKYIKTNEWKGRAGAYSIRDKASLFIKKINGSPSNVIGFPMHKLYELLRNHFRFNLFQLE